MAAGIITASPVIAVTPTSKVVNATPEESFRVTMLPVLTEAPAAYITVNGLAALKNLKYWPWVHKYPSSRKAIDL